MDLLSARRRSSIYTLLGVLSLLLPSIAMAGPEHRYGKDITLGELFQVEFAALAPSEKKPEKETPRFVSKRQAREEVILSHGAKLNLMYPVEWTGLRATVAERIHGIHDQFVRIFGVMPELRASVRLMEEEHFFLSTGAPRWTNAIFFKGQILIPVSTKDLNDPSSLLRSLTHEYLHAVIHSLSEGKCPGWIDEGLAQLVEGPENPALRPALYEFLKDNPPVPFSLMQSGFTRLDTEMVAAAYAQSLIAAKALVETYGFGKLRVYLDELKGGRSHNEAFNRVFTVTEADFERRFSRKLERWVSSYAQFEQVTFKEPPARSIFNGPRAAFQ